MKKSKFTDQLLAFVLKQAESGTAVKEVLERVACDRKLPKTIRVENGPEFTSKVLDRSAYANGITLDISRPEKPSDNAFIESFNGSVRTVCLNENCFMSLDDAKEKTEAWHIDYNEHRLHIALGNLAPKDFASIGRARPAN